VSQGFVAEAIDRFCRTQEIMDTSGRRHRGVLTADDMAKWQATVEAPVSYDYGRYTVLKASTWTQGLVTLQQLALCKRFGFDGLDPTGPDFIHFQVEAAKLAFADRDTFYGDPKFVDVPIETLLSDAYNDARAKLITGQASLEIRPGTISGFGKTMGLRLAEGQRAAVANSGAGEPTVGNIPWTHDEDDLPDALAVQARKREKMAQCRATPCISTSSTRPQHDSSTPSGGWLHSSPVIPELGFCLGTRAQMFWLEKVTPPRSRRASGRARRSRPPWRCATASRISPGLARRRPAGPVDHAVLPAPRPCRHELAGSDRCAGLAHRAFSFVVLAAHRAPGRAGGRRPGAQGDAGGVEEARAQARGRCGLVGRAADRGLARRQAP